MVVTLRPARAGDRDGIVEVFHDCWQLDYPDVLPPALTNAMTLRRATLLWERLLPGRPQESSASVLVAERDGATRHPAIVGVSRFTHEPGGSGTVDSLYVSPFSQKEGTGRLLLGAAAAALRQLGADPVTLWVFAANAPSLGFYRSQGWAPNGRTRTQSEFGEPEVQLQLGSHPGPGRFS